MIPSLSRLHFAGVCFFVPFFFNCKSFVSHVCELEKDKTGSLGIEKEDKANGRSGGEGFH